MEIFTHDDGFPDGDEDDLRNSKSQRKQINSNMRDARNLSIAGRCGEERNIMEPTKKDTFFVAGLLFREFTEEHALNETVGRARSFSSYVCMCSSWLLIDGSPSIPIPYRRASAR